MVNGLNIKIKDVEWFRSSDVKILYINDYYDIYVNGICSLGKDDRLYWFELVDDLVDTYIIIEIRDKDREHMEFMYDIYLEKGRHTIKLRNWLNENPIKYSPVEVIGYWNLII